MSTYQIISSSISFVNRNIDFYFYVLFIPVILSIIGIFLYPFFTLNIFYSILSTIVYIITVFYSYKAVISIHRFIILNENPNNFNFQIKRTFIYFLYTWLLILVAIGPFILAITTLLLSPDNFILVGVSILLFFLGFIWLFISICFFSLNFPLIAIGKKVSFFKMWNLSKGFRLTLFLQTLCLTVITAIGNGLIQYFENTFLTIVIWIMDYYLFVIFITCLSKTHILWVEKKEKVL